MRTVSFQSLFSFYLGCVALLFCVAPKSVTLLIVGMLFFVIFGYIKKKLVFSLSRPMIFLALLYIAYLIGVAFTHDQALASRYVENKLSFLVFPLLFSFRSKEPLTLSGPLIGLSLGIVAASVIGFINTLDCDEWVYGPVGCYTGSIISPIHHPTYFCVFILVALSGNWISYSRKEKGFLLWWLLPFTLFALLMYVLCFSLAGLLFAMILFVVLAGIFVYRKFGRRVLIITCCCSPLLFIAIFSIPRLKLDIINTKNAVSAYMSDPVKFVSSDSGSNNGDDLRLVMWTVAAQKFMENPLGVGTGNVDAHLRGRLSTYGQHGLAGKEEVDNPHNQYLQTGLEIGVEGLLILVLIITSSIRFAWKHKNWLLLILMSSLAFNCLFESMLQRQSGIVFYSFWMCLLIAYSRSVPGSGATPVNLQSTP